MPTFGNSIISLDTVDSTNNYAANLLKQSDVAEGTVVLSRYQTQGRGQRGATWLSEAGNNLLMSLVVKPSKLEPSRQFAVNQLVCIALVDYLRGHFDIEAVIKWPNDILVDEQKLGGILIENGVRGNTLEYCIAGIGLNVNQRSFPEDWKVTSLAVLTGKQHDIGEMVRALLPIIEREYELLGKPDVLEQRFTDRLYGVKEWLYYREGNEVFRAKVSGLGPHGELRLKKENGEISECVFKQVELLGKSL